MKTLLLLALAIGGVAAAAPARDVTPRASIPATLSSSVPKHGIYLAGGGLVSSAWRIVIDFDTGKLEAGTNPKSGSASYGTLPKMKSRVLTKSELERARKLAGAAWSEPAPATGPRRPSADYSELLIVADDDDTFYFDGYGPIRRPAAANAITELRKLAGL